ncbi:MULTISPECIES: phosphoenolpyruvate hydrolase family protein [unclassified Clostridium]|uniref:phosphoenolpyruvate hydrolase family protein n=1 Tax=unclassified Clostridium TaxID=2614128 RepID=UPI001105F655|nr:MULTISPECIES: phosphoenolpyruvate hydrolase family protein [unclassified Clostridium]
MAVQFSRTEIRANLEQCIKRKQPIVVADVGMGITAKFSEAGGADMISIDLAGLFRVDAVSSIAAIMPYANANEKVLARAKKIMPHVKNIPVCVGISASDPTIDSHYLLKSLHQMGVSAVANSPSTGYFINRERNDFEDAGMGGMREAEVLHMAQEMGFFTVGYAYDTAGARLIGRAGPDVLVCDFRVTSGGTIGIESAYTEDEAITLTKELAKAAKAEEQSMFVLIHGGPVISASSTKRFYQETPAVGVLGGSIIERLPVEEAIKEAAQRFKMTTIRSGGTQ